MKMPAAMAQTIASTKAVLELDKAILATLEDKAGAEPWEAQSFHTRLLVVESRLAFNAALLVAQIEAVYHVGEEQ